MRGQTSALIARRIYDCMLGQDIWVDAFLDIAIRAVNGAREDGEAMNRLDVNQVGMLVINEADADEASAP